MSNLHLLSNASDVPASQRNELDEIVYRISHDLRQSVRALKELPGWLQEDLESAQVNLGEEPERTLELIQSHARRLDEMLNGLLAYSRVGRLQEIVTVQPQKVFEDVVSELAPGQDVTFFRQFNPVQVRIGSADIAKVFTILIANAIRHNPAKQKQVEIVSCRSGNVWELLVSDNGPGIEKADEEKIFKPMVKLVSRDEDEGGGMGLAVLRKITDTYDGSVHLEHRRRRRGTTFRVRLPVLV